jgi:hypothetical protein
METDSLYEIGNVNGVRVLNFATSKNLIIKSTMFPHRNINKCTGTSPNGKTRNQSEHTLIGRRRQSSVLDVRPFRADGCDANHYLGIAKVRDRLSVCKRETQKLI